MSFLARRSRTQYSLARQARTQYELSLHEKELTDWCFELLGEQRDSKVTLKDYLQDGSVLCRMMNSLRPGSIPKFTKPDPSGKPLQVYKILDNVNRFLDVCKQNKFVPVQDLFLPQDLIEMQNFSQVLSCLLTIKKHIEEENRSEALVQNLRDVRRSPVLSPKVNRLAPPSPKLIDRTIHEQKQTHEPTQEPAQENKVIEIEVKTETPPPASPTVEHHPPEEHETVHETASDPTNSFSPPPPPPPPEQEHPVEFTPKLSRAVPSTNTMLGVIERRSEQLSTIKKQLELEKHNRALAEANVAQLQKQIEAINQRMEVIVRTRSESISTPSTNEFEQEIEKLKEQVLIEKEQAKIRERDIRKQREDERRVAALERENLNKKIQDLSLILHQLQKQQNQRELLEKQRSVEERKKKEIEERERLNKERKDLEERERIVKEEREKFLREEKERIEKEEVERKEKEEEERKKLVDELRQQLAQEERERLEKEEKERWERELRERREREERERIERERKIKEIEERLEKERQEIIERDKREREERARLDKEREEREQKEKEERELREKEERELRDKEEKEREEKVEKTRFEEGIDENKTGKYIWVKDREIWIDPSMILKWDDLNIIKRVNGGGYAEIFEAELCGETVAVKKFIDKDVEKARQELYNELYAFSILRSTNVVPVFGYCFDVPSIVMEYFHRGSLAFILWCENIKLPWNRRWIFTRDIAIGLNRMHSKKLLHCDVKSGNFLVRNDWKLLVSDFGCVRPSISNDTEPFIGGTVNWTAPEVFDDQPYTDKADVYSFAMVMYEIATRKQPWYQLSDSPDSQLQIRRKVGTGERPPLPSDTPAPFVDLMMRCWSQNPGERPDFTQILEFLSLQGIDDEVSNLAENDDSGSENLQEELDMEKNMNSMYRKRIDELTTQLNEEMSTVSEMKRAALHMELKLEKAERDMRRYEKLSEEMERMKTENKAASKATELEQQLENLQKEYKKLEKKLERVENQKKRLEEDFENLVSRKPRERGGDEAPPEDDKEARRSRRREDRDAMATSVSEPTSESAESRRERRRKEKEQEDNEEAEREKRREERRKAREERKKET